MSDQFPPPGEPTPPPGEPVPPTPPADATPPPPPPPAAPVPPPAAGPPASHAAGGSPATEPWSVGNAFSYGWNKFTQHVGAILIAILALVVVALVVGFIWALVVGGIQHAIVGDPQITIDPNTGAISTSGGGGFFVGLIFMAINVVVWATLFGFIQAAITRVALAITEGKKIEAGIILSTERLSEVLVTALLVGVFTAIGYLFCGVGALVVEFFLFFTWYFLLDKGLGPMDSIKASFDFVKGRVGDVLVFLIVAWVVLAIGALLCGVGTIVAAPVVIIATAYTYKKFTDQPVAA